jgi:hypothetical protein
MKNIFILIVLLGTISMHSACKKNESTIGLTNQTFSIPEGLIKIGETYIIGAKAKACIYAEKTPFVGYNHFIVAMYDSIDGSRLTEGHLNLSATMNMGSMSHNCPVDSNEEIDEQTKLFNTGIVFIMPGTRGWELSLHFHNHKYDIEADGIFPISVVESNPKSLSSAILPLDDSAIVFVSILFPNKVKVGLNDVEFLIYKKVNNTYFPAITDYTTEIVPLMPSMGHGSPNNINPIHSINGHYKGKVNFTMSGLWQIQLKLAKNGVLLSDQIYFETTL